MACRGAGCRTTEIAERGREGLGPDRSASGRVKCQAASPDEEAGLGGLRMDLDGRRREKRRVKLPAQSLAQATGGALY